MVFHEEGEWKFGTKKTIYFDNLKRKHIKKFSQSPTSSTFKDNMSERRVTRKQRHQDIYDNTEALSPRWVEYLYEEDKGTNNPALLCLYAYYKSLNFEETLQDMRSRKTID